MAIRISRLKSSLFSQIYEQLGFHKRTILAFICDSWTEFCTSPFLFLVRVVFVRKELFWVPLVYFAVWSILSMSLWKLLYRSLFWSLRWQAFVAWRFIHSFPLTIYCYPLVQKVSIQIRCVSWLWCMSFIMLFARLLLLVDPVPVLSI